MDKSLSVLAPAWLRSRGMSQGVVVFVFSDGSRAGEFNGTYRKKCTARHLWKNVCVYEWAVDLEAEVIQRHFSASLGRMLNHKKLAEAVFGKS